VAAVQDEVWTPHVLEDAVERERLERAMASAIVFTPNTHLMWPARPCARRRFFQNSCIDQIAPWETQAASRGSREAARAA